ncbi:MAG: helicase C-terminal domain-containing protein [Thermodesulfovibrionales bacterium]|jgi:ATP-dependent DNA helicase DinG
MDNFFGSGGILSEVVTGYETRVEQVQMSEAVADALESGKHLIVEAGTGVGKSLAYLIPFICHAMAEEGGRAVVSTYTRALQRQLIEKELPFLRDHVFEGLRFALCLGSENYLCLRRLDQVRTDVLFDTDETEGLRSIARWAKRTSTGIRSEIDIPQQLWQKVCRESDLCHGKDCKKFDDCHYQESKAAERKAHILVANHHLFFANVASGWNVIPHFDSVVFDEAHELEDVAADYLGIEFSQHKLRHLTDSVLNAQGKGLLSRLRLVDPFAHREISSLTNLVRRQGETFFDELSVRLTDATKLRIRERGFMKNDLSTALTNLADALTVLKESTQDEDEKTEIAALALRSEALGLSLRLILDQQMDNHVYWAEKDGRRRRLVATPLDIASILKTQVFDAVTTAVLTSATLATDESFTFVKERLGLADARTLLLHSPFDYHAQVVLYMPDDVGEPGTALFEDDLIQRLRDILSITQGSTLVLFTSFTLLTKVYHSMKLPSLELIRQGERDSYRLVQMFKKNKHSVLLGTYSFWQGIDIPGDALRCVVITKLPFAVPDEPVMEARMEALTVSGKNPFSHYQIPQAIILLKQGFGRLIRTKTDRGAVVILDSRIRTRRYGSRFLKSLPACKIAAALGDIAEFAGKRGSEGGDEYEAEVDSGVYTASPQPAERASKGLKS